MTTIEKPPNLRRTRPDVRTYRLPVSSYERVASLLLSLLVLIGVVVLMLLIIWLTNQIFTSKKTPPTPLEEIGDGGGGIGGGEDFDVPPAEEMDLEEPELEKTLAAVADAVAAKALMLDNSMLSDQIRAGRGGEGGGRGVGPGRPGVPRRWEVQFHKGNTRRSYAAQLDYFGIELGVLLPKNRVAYAHNLTRATPSRREGPADKEGRYYLTWRRGDLEKLDRQLLADAGIGARGKFVLKFVPPNLEAELAGLQKAYRGRDAKEIRKTVFGVRPDGDGYKFYVLVQTYR